MTSRYRCCPIILFWSFRSNFGSLISSSGSFVDLGAASHHHHPIPHRYRRSYPRLAVGGCHPEESSCGHHASVSAHHLCRRLVGHDKQPKKIVRLLTFIATFTHLAAVLLSKIGVTSRAYGPPSPLCTSMQPQSSRIFRLGSGRPTIAAFTIDKMIVSTIDLTIGTIDSISPGQCHEKSWVLFSPTLFPAMLGST